MTQKHVDQYVNDGVVLHLRKINTDSRQGMSLSVLSELNEALDRTRTDSSIRCVIIDAAGDGFHDGAVMMGELTQDLAALKRKDYRRIVEMGYELARNLAALDVPLIGIAAGGALGGGLEMLCRCDLVYTTDGAAFSFPEVRLGLVAGWGGTQWASRILPMRKAQELLLLGEPISGKEAEECNLVTRSFANRPLLDAHVNRVIERLKRCSPLSLRKHKECLRAVWQGSLREGEGVENAAFVDAASTGAWIRPTLAWRLDGKDWDYTQDGPIDP